MTQLLQIETLVLELLLIVSIVAIIVKRFRIPYTVALVLAGLLLSLRVSLDVQLTPELILSLLLPPLVFESAFHINIRRLRQNIGIIAVLAIPGVILNMLIVGSILSYGAGMTLSIALVFGALIAATDPVSVIAIFRRLGAPKQLEILLEGESLFNDGTAIVIFGLALEIVDAGSFNFLGSIFNFIEVAGGGIAVGFLLGWLASRLIARIDDYVVETTLTTVLAFGSYLVAEQFHLSGVLAVVVAGLVSGNIGDREMSPTTRIGLVNFWEYMAFLSNSAIFLLIGLDIEIASLIDSANLIIWAIFAVLVARAIGIYALSRLGGKIPDSWRHAQFWGGLRGAISLALALSIPIGFGPQRRTMIEMTYGVVLFSLVIQGMTMNGLLTWLGIIGKSEEEFEYERRHARAIAANAGLERVRELSEDGLVSAHTWRTIKPLLEQRLEALIGSVREVIQENPHLEAEEFETARSEMLRAQKTALRGMRTSGTISEETYAELVTELNLALSKEEQAWARYAFEPRGKSDIQHFMMAVVQSPDLESATNALAIRGIRVTRIQSRGGFLRERNHILVMGIPKGRLQDAKQTMERACHKRVKYVDPRNFGQSSIPDDQMKVDLHGTTAFVFDVDRVEVI